MPTQTLQLFVLAIVFTTVLAASQGIYWTWVAHREKQQQEVMRRLGAQNDDDDLPGHLLRSQGDDDTARALGGIGSSLSDLLIRADSPLGVSDVLRRCILSAFVVMLIGMYFLGPALGFFALLPGAFLPIIMLRRQGAKRSKDLVSQLPDTLELMSRSMQAGMGLSDTFKLVATEMPMPIAGEFGRIFEEVRFGRDYRDAFLKMLDRNPGIFDLRLLVSSILLQRETGGNLIEILENISGTIRGRFGFKDKVGAMTAEAKFTGYLLAGLPIAVVGMLNLINPDYLDPLFNSGILGYGVLGYVACSYGIGIFLMQEISKVEV